MSASNAPTYYFTGIEFNSSFYNESATGDLTLAQANALFLKKTVADTATAVETFNAGIKTNGINSLQSIDSVSIKVDELVVGFENSKNYVVVDKCYFTVGTGNEATIDTKTAIPIHIAPSTTVEPNAICTGVVIGNSTIPVTINATTTTLSSPLTLGSVPTANTQLGFKENPGIITTAGGTGVVYGTITIGASGIYLFNFNINQTIALLGNTHYMRLAGSGIPTGIDFGGTTLVSSGTIRMAFCGSQVVTCTASNYTLTLTSTSAISAVPTGFFTATRIG